MTKKYQITELCDYFSQKEVIEIIKKLKKGKRIQVIRLTDGIK